MAGEFGVVAGEDAMKAMMRAAGRAVFLLWFAALPITVASYAEERLTLEVLGQPRSAGDIQKYKEEPFFHDLSEKTGLPFAMEYSPQDLSSVSDVQTLAALRSGRVQIASLRISQVGKMQPMFLGLDLVGLNTDYPTGRRVIDAYGPVLDKWLQDSLAVKLLGAWPFGPQILYCVKPIRRLADIKGLKVRVYGDPDLVKLIRSIGGLPVQLDTREVGQGLSSGAVDCAIASPTTASDAHWPKVKTYVLPVAFQLGVNGYAMSLSAWNRLTPLQQTRLATAFESLVDEIWTYSEQLSRDAILCNTGKASCGTQKTLDLTEIPASDADVALVRTALRRFSLPRWAEVCDGVDPGCSTRWKKAVGPLVESP